MQRHCQFSYGGVRQTAWFGNHIVVRKGFSTDTRIFLFIKIIASRVPVHM